MQKDTLSITKNTNKYSNDKSCVIHLNLIKFLLVYIAVKLGIVIYQLFCMNASELYPDLKVRKGGVYSIL